MKVFLCVNGLTPPVSFWSSGFPLQSINIQARLSGDWIAHCWLRLAFIQLCKGKAITDHLLMDYKLIINECLPESSSQMSTNHQVWINMFVLLTCCVNCRDLKPENILLDDNGEFSNFISLFLVIALHSYFVLWLILCFKWHYFQYINVSLSHRTHPYFWPWVGHQSAWRRTHSRQGGDCGLHG